MTHTEPAPVTLDAAEALAREALPAYNIDPATPLSLLKQRENFVFGLSYDGRDYVLRVHRRGYHSDAALRCELEFVEALRSEDVSVPEFLHNSNDDTFCLVGAESAVGEHQVDLQRHIPNQGNFGDEHSAVSGTAQIDPSDFRELGRLAAEAHNAAENSGYVMSEPRGNWDLEGLVGAEPTWGDPLRIPELTGDDRTAVEQAIARIREVLTSYGQPARRYGPIHADMTAENVLRTENGLVLIDFDDFAEGWHLFDLATSLWFFTPHPRYEEYRAELFAGYEELRPLDAADHEAFAAILLARGLTYFGWAADRRGEETAEFLVSTVLPHLVGVARALIA